MPQFKTKVIKIETALMPFVHGFLSLAEGGLNALMLEDQCGKKKWFDEQDKAMYDLFDGGKIIAIVFNIRHGIELLLKNISVQKDGKCLSSHDLNELLLDLENKIQDFCLEEHLDFLKEVVQRYVSWWFSTKNQPNDPMNELTRFGQSKNGNKKLLYAFVHDLSKKDLEQMRNDCHNLKRLNDLLEGQPRWFTTMKRIGASKQEVKTQMRSVSTIKNPGFKKYSVKN
ncbi:MAG: hypothetical protein A3I05_09515 [Deltaproteobacteria bacterium RIFCSPLOWO2_02_FULL_44_10]|nr:MAG: hypothetical protein A3C46_02680 [Deltaproteobacteria bacterium RIFCSPHIGHO2_02_FULL_44_16]OGQ47139.1 MAG: hypothetical protein A3I05_09515 [Deltaproteobacteria bacterium RIFCSPLOWO2_02_FULL_44_10]